MFKNGQKMLKTKTKNSERRNESYYRNKLKKTGLPLQEAHCFPVYF